MFGPESNRKAPRIVIRGMVFANVNGVPGSNTVDITNEDIEAVMIAKLNAAPFSPKVVIQSIEMERSTTQKSLYVKITNLQLLNALAFMFTVGRQV